MSSCSMLARIDIAWKYFCLFVPDVSYIWYVHVSLSVSVFTSASVFLLSVSAYCCLLPFVTICFCLSLSFSVFLCVHRCVSVCLYVSFSLCVHLYVCLPLVYLCLLLSVTICCHLFLPFSVFLCVHMCVSMCSCVQCAHACF